MPTLLFIYFSESPTDGSPKTKKRKKSSSTKREAVRQESPAKSSESAHESDMVAEWDPEYRFVFFSDDCFKFLFTVSHGSRVISSLPCCTARNLIVTIFFSSPRDKFQRGFRANPLWGPLLRFRRDVKDHIDDESPLAQAVRRFFGRVDNAAIEVVREQSVPLVLPTVVDDVFEAFTDEAMRLTPKYRLLQSVSQFYAGESHDTR